MAQGISRRTFFSSVAGSALGLAVAACSDSDGAPELVGLYSTDSVIVAGLESQRIPFAVVESTTNIVTDQTNLSVRLLKGDEELEVLTVAAHIVEHDHVATDEHDGHQHSEVNRYFPLRATLPEPGVYDIEVAIGGYTVTHPVQAFAREEVAGLVPGEAFKPVVTPTVEDMAGVDTLCTREVECALHSKTPADLLGKQAFALLVATPELCATAYCGPVLETLLAAKPDYPEIEFIHAEVYANVADVNGNYADPNIELAAHMEELDLEFEPVIYFVNSDGIMIDKLDNVFDATELTAELDALV